MTARKNAAWALAALAAVGAVAICWQAVELYRMPPRFLLACYDTESNPTAWACREIFVHARLGSKDVAELNREGGALYAASLSDLAAAEEMLTTMIEKGVDINAGHQRSANLTALHSMVLAGDVERVEMLLRHGASVNVKNSVSGSTPLDDARVFQARWPDQKQRAKVMALLEAHRSVR